ncbi:DUF6310 domain-containing protein [Cystobacter fuscus]|uniref:DUF6310 domain-containing protein n=1 Tax=Cystobacter fuscus TaxID=43 RepID=UPI002B303002|nr:hypothetical protein F0U63_23285 [Cystobacter fuscus]
MRFRACIALLLHVSACATSAPSPRAPAARAPELANLQRAATLPWTDGGRCAVQEATEPWPVLVERCFQALDHDRLEFHDPTGRCSIASAGAAAVGLGVCVLAAPELVVGAVIVTGVVVVGFAIQEALETYAEKKGRPQVRPAPEARPVSETKPPPQEPSPKQRPKPEPGSSEDWPPPLPPELSERERRPECKPLRVPPKGGNRLHNKCADGIPFNAYRGANALVNGKAFDALQVVAGMLWEVKTDNFDTYPIELQDIVIRKNVRDFLIERELARACGFDFRVGVRSATHKTMLETDEPRLMGVIVLMDWC